MMFRINTGRPWLGMNLDTIGTAQDRRDAELMYDAQQLRGRGVGALMLDGVCMRGWPQL